MITLACRRLAAAAALALPLLLAACGGSGAHPPNTPGPAGPAATASPGVVPPPVESPIARNIQGPAIAFSDGSALWIAAADGRQRQKLIESACLELDWSPAADRVACASAAGGGPSPGRSLKIVTTEGKVVYQADGLAPGSIAWSKAGGFFSYVLQDSAPAAASTAVVVDAGGKEIKRLDIKGRGAWSPAAERFAFVDAGGKVSILETGDGSETPLQLQATSVLAWVLGGDYLLIDQSPPTGGAYDNPLQPQLVSLRDLGARPLPPLTQFWLSPMSDQLASLGPTHPDGIELFVIDLKTMTRTDLPDSRTGYPSEGIPDGNVAFSQDGKQLFWLNAFSLDKASLNKADLATGIVTRLGVPPGFVVRFSPDRTRIAVPRSDGSRQTLVVTALDGSNLVDLGPALPSFDWRP